MTDYDKLAQDYGKYRRLHPGLLQVLLNDVHKSTVVLEVGCGTGNYVSAIEAARGCVCHGVDPSAEMLTQARAKSDRVAWHSGKAQRLPVGDESIDFVFSVDVIHHVADRRRYFAEAFRVLRPEGIVCTATDSERIIKQRPLAQYFPETVAIELERYPAISDLRSLMEIAGFIGITECVVEQEFLLSDIEAYRRKTFSALQLISDTAFQQGISRMEQDLRNGPLRIVSRYAILKGTSPRRRSGFPT